MTDAKDAAGAKPTESETECRVGRKWGEGKLQNINYKRAPRVIINI